MKARQMFGLAAASVTVAAGVIVGFPGIALAHTPNVDDTCTGLSVNLTSYETISGPTKNNKVTVTIDNSINVDVSDANFFDGSFTKTYSWAQYESHTWTVVIDANINASTNKTTYDKTFTGTQEACQQPQPTTVAWTPTDGTCANPSGGSLAVSYNADKATYAGSAAGSYPLGAAVNGQFTAKPGFTISGNAGPFAHTFVVSNAPCPLDNNPFADLVKVECKSWTADFSNDVGVIQDWETVADAQFDLVIDGDVAGAEHIVLAANDTAHRDGSFPEDSGSHTVTVGETTLSLNTDCAPNGIVPPHLTASYDCVNEESSPELTDSEDAEHYVVGNITLDPETNTYSVTITPAEGYTFGEAATNENGSVTLTASFVVTTDCEEVVVTPFVTPPTCASIGSVDLPESRFFTWTANEDGTYTATAKEGFRLVGQRTFGPFNLAQLVEGCVGPKPDDKVVTSDWVDGTWKCDDTIVDQSRTVTTTSYSLVDGQWVENAPVVATEHQSRDLTAAEQFKCPQVESQTQPPADPAPSTPVQELPKTGSNVMLAGLGLLMLAGGAVLLVTARRPRQA